MKRTRAIIEQAFRQYRPALAYSGGGDSTVLLDIVAGMGYRPPLIYSDSQMEYSTSLPFVNEQAARYGLPLHIAKAKLTPLKCWQRYGYPMLGKMAARIWMQKHPSAQWGFKVDVSTCCRKMKIAPAREMVRNIGCNATLTGQRGAQDDRLRGMRAHKDGAICELKQDHLTQINPLNGWTDLMVLRYTKQHNLPVNPARKAGALTIGCMYCGGGAQFDNSGFRVLRHVAPAEWRRLIIDFGFGPIIIAIKYGVPLADATAALHALGGLQAVADTMPHVFDFLRINPLKGYDR
jgi:3'-phosphoadenosine 5'-phosphosulfate sulfotransferase (PAPS reductase)/FAD synthetase